MMQSAPPIMPVPHTINGIAVARLTHLGATGADVRCDDGTVRRAIVACDAGALASGMQVAVMFQNGDANLPIILGPMQQQAEPVMVQPGCRITQDNEQIEISHARQIVLRCGESVLTLSADGRIKLNGEHLLSTARGTNRISGASVKIN